MIIGLTGQTGAGKSTVCHSFKEKGLVVIDCDKVAREVTQKGSRTLSELSKAFGNEIILSDGSLDRAALAQIAFSSPEKTNLLNAITHPAILNSLKEKIAKYPNEIIVLDAPTLLESGAYRLCDKIIAVVADENIRKQRIMRRDNLSQQQAEQRMKAQKDDAFYAQHADAVIYNNQDTCDLEKAIEQVLKKIGV